MPWPGTIVAKHVVVGPSKRLFVPANSLPFPLLNVIPLLGRPVGVYSPNCRASLELARGRGRNQATHVFWVISAAASVASPFPRMPRLGIRAVLLISDVSSAPSGLTLCR